MRFDTIKLSELAAIQTGPFGSQLHKEDYVVHGTPIVTVEHLGSRKFTEQNLPCVSDKDKERLKKYVLKTGDIVFSRVGSVDRCSYVSAEYEGWMFSGRCLRVRPCEKLNPEYLYYFFLLEETKQFVRNIATGATMPSINTKFMGEIPIRVPSLETQNKIASILWMIDDKIELNEKVNNNLEQQAQAIFKSWFVDFEPFNGEMPFDWTVSRLGDIASIKTNSFSPVKNPDAQLEHYSIPAYDEQKYPVFESAAGVKSNKYILSKNSVMISKLNPDAKRVWRPMCLSELAVSSTEFIIFEAFNPAYRDFVFSIIDCAAFSDWMCAHTTGSTNSRQRTTPSATLEFQVTLPDEKTITDFCAIVTPMYDAIAANICENQRLAQLRDSILPKLMSGELDVSDIDL
jgi:type I restriction enzyme S subunit